VVYINTAQEFDGSDYGAQSDEAVSWGKIKGSAKPICIESWDVFSILLMEAKVLI
jgi:deoxyhypusine synthase